MELAWTDTLQRNDNSIAKHALQWTSQGHRRRGRPRNTWRRDLESEMGTAGFKYNWRKMEAAAETELDGGKWSVAATGTGSDMAQVKSSIFIFCKI